MDSKVIGLIVAGIVVIGGLAVAVTNPQIAESLRGAAASGRGFSPSAYYLQLAGTQCGAVRAFEGGLVTAEVITEAIGPDSYAHKHLGQPKYEDITITFGSTMCKEMFEWIDASWRGDYQRKDGAIITADANGQVHRILEFQGALLREVTTPALDAGSRDAAFVKAVITPEFLSEKRGEGATLKATSTKTQTKWAPANFKFEMTPLPTTRVNKIDAITVKQTVTTEDIGDARDYGREPGKLEFPNLKVTFAEVDSAKWIEWHTDFVVNGNNHQESEKSGRIVWLTPDLRTEIGDIALSNCGIFRLTPEPSSADSVKRLTAEMYCERYDLNWR